MNMKRKVEEIFERFFEDNPSLEVSRNCIYKAFETIVDCYKQGGKVLICGNGGSASDSEHIVGELMKGFLLKRPLCGKAKKEIEELFPADCQYLADNLQGALPAISLVSNTAISSAFINDVQPDMVFAQQVYGYGKPGDILLGLSTSGNSTNVINAVKISKVLGLKTVGMTGEAGGKMKELCDVTICVPAKETYRVQEFHLPVYHALCAMIEEEFFGEGST
jgi:phosphoheptose isomerase